MILAARRTPIGSFQGAFKDVSAVELGVTAAQATLAGFRGEDVADVLIGNVLQAGSGMNPARQIALGSGLPEQVPGQTINRVCGSGMQTVITAVHGLRADDGDLYLAGGVESMSRAPFLVTQMRGGHKLGDTAMIDSMVHDGLTDARHHYHMGITAENVAERYGISREEQDRFAYESHVRAAQAHHDGSFGAEIVAVSVASRKGPVIVDRDESVRHDASIEALGKLRPVFRKDGGTVTAGNASGLNDGAAMLLLASEAYARQHSLQALGEIVGYATVGIDPALMGMGPAAAIPIALRKAGLELGDVDEFELNEAFASQSIAVCRELNLASAKVNATGGAIALGHPIGASGARVLVTLIHRLRREGKRYGVASLCIGGGMGIAVVVRASSE